MTVGEVVMITCAGIGKREEGGGGRERGGISENLSFASLRDSFTHQWRHVPYLRSS